MLSTLDAGVASVPSVQANRPPVPAVIVGAVPVLKESAALSAPAELKLNSLVPPDELKTPELNPVAPDHISTKSPDAVASLMMTGTIAVPVLLWIPNTPAVLLLEPVSASTIG